MRGWIRGVCGERLLVSPPVPRIGGMWRIPVFLASFFGYFLAETLACVWLDQAGLDWLALVLLFVGGLAGVLGTLRMLDWVVRG